MQSSDEIYSDHNSLEVYARRDDNAPYVNGHLYDIKGISAVHETLRFQQGPVKEFGVNGITSEAVLAILIDRLLILDGQFPCDENKVALQHLSLALTALETRTKKRIVQGVEGTSANHT